MKTTVKKVFLDTHKEEEWLNEQGQNGLFRYSYISVNAGNDHAGVCTALCTAKKLSVFVSPLKCLPGVSKQGIV